MTQRLNVGKWWKVDIRRAQSTAEEALLVEPEHRFSHFLMPSAFLHGPLKLRGRALADIAALY